MPAGQNNTYYLFIIQQSLVSILIWIRWNGVFPSFSAESRDGGDSWPCCQVNKLMLCWITQYNAGLKLVLIGLVHDLNKTIINVCKSSEILHVLSALIEVFSWLSVSALVMVHAELRSISYEKHLIVQETLNPRFRVSGG